jgi:hypothetical protein
MNERCTTDSFGCRFLPMQATAKMRDGSCVSLWETLKPSSCTANSIVIWLLPSCNHIAAKSQFFRGVIEEGIA